jgi:hypothetical protein
MNYELMDFAVAKLIAEKYAKANDKEGLRNFLIAFEGAKLDFAYKTKKMGVMKRSLTMFFRAFYKKYPLALA